MQLHPVRYILPVFSVFFTALWGFQNADSQERTSREPPQNNEKKTCELNQEHALDSCQCPKGSSFRLTIAKRRLFGICACGNQTPIANLSANECRSCPDGKSWNGSDCACAGNTPRWDGKLKKCAPSANNEVSINGSCECPAEKLHKKTKKSIRRRRKKIYSF